MPNDADLTLVNLNLLLIPCYSCKRLRPGPDQVETMSNNLD